MDTIKLLRTVDFIEGRVDLNSVHPKKLSFLIQKGLIERVDPGDGESSFFLISELGIFILNLEKIPLWVNLVLTSN